MKPVTYIKLSVTVLLSYVPFVAVAAGKSLSGDQIFSLMQSSRSQYVSVEAVLVCQGFQYTSENKENAELKYEQTIDYKRFMTHTFCHQITTTYSVNSQRTYKEVFLITPGMTKYFREDLTGDHRMVGEISEKSGMDRLSYTPDIIIWQDSPEGWERHSKNAKNIQSLRDNTGNYLFEFPINAKGSCFRYVIDPRKNYIPVKRDILFPDKTVMVHEECDNFRQVGNLSVPFHFTWFDPTAKFGGEYKVLSMKVNEIKSPQELDFQFPKGTIVQDKVRGIRYKVGDDVSATNTVADSNNINVNLSGNAGLPPSATNTQLADAAMKAQELLAKEKQTAAEKQAVVPVEVSPSYVWVLPGKNEYVLSVNSKSDKTPGLVGHSIEANGLVLNAVDNQISSSSQIKVTLERPGSLKDYADGVMTLEFNDQKATVHFIAAPLE